MMNMNNVNALSHRDRCDLQIAEAMAEGPEALSQLYEQNGFNSAALGNLFDLNADLMKLLNEVVVYCGYGDQIDVQVGVAGLRTEALRVLYLSEDFKGFRPYIEVNNEAADAATRQLIDSLSQQDSDLLHDLVVNYEMGDEIDVYANDFHSELIRVQEIFWAMNDEEMNDDEEMQDDDEAENYGNNNQDY